MPTLIALFLAWSALVCPPGEAVSEEVLDRLPGLIIDVELPEVREDMPGIWSPWLTAPHPPFVMPPGATIRPPLRHWEPPLPPLPQLEIELDAKLIELMMNQPFVAAPNSVDEERMRNDEAFRLQYLDVRTWLFEHYAGHWIVIVGGEVFPRDAEGRIVPAHTMEEAVAAGEAAYGDALHRYVFRVGEDGDAHHHFTMSPHADVGGRQFLLLLSPHTIVGPDGLYLRDAPLGEPGASKRINHARGDGVYANVAFAPPSAARKVVDRKAVRIDLHVATAFSGFATLSHEHGEQLDAARWEIPGTIHVDGWPPMRRARVHASMEGTALHQLIIVGVRPPAAAPTPPAAG